MEAYSTLPEMIPSSLTHGYLLFITVDLIFKGTMINSILFKECKQINEKGKLIIKVVKTSKRNENIVEKAGGSSPCFVIP